MKSILTRSFLFLFLLISAPIVHATDITSLPSDTSGVVDKAVVDEALKEFRSLSKQERKARLKEARKLYKEYRSMKNNAAAADGSVNIVLLAILAILLPPLAVYLKEGEINTKFWISLVLTLLFFVPGVIYALLVVFDAV